MNRSPAMGCELVVSGATDEQLAAIGALIEDFDARFSRFRAGSELCRVNASRGRAVLVSEAFAVALTLALAAAQATGGL
ncbi:MAG: ApbE family, partial [Solirubrobacteraceae bacterium]|nr:ApbE family [Solirubrobacteraceae bacterium]